LHEHQFGIQDKHATFAAVGGHTLLQREQGLAHLYDAFDHPVYRTSLVQLMMASGHLACLVNETRGFTGLLYTFEAGSLV